MPGHRLDRSRVVTYEFEGEFSEPAAEKMLSKARDQGIVTAYDTGRGHFMWFTGRPGRRMRKLKGLLRSLLICHFRMKLKAGTL